MPRKEEKNTDFSERLQDNSTAYLEKQLQEIIIESSDMLDTSHGGHENESTKHQDSRPTDKSRIPQPPSSSLPSLPQGRLDVIPTFKTGATLQERKDLFVRYIQDQIQTLKIRTNVLHFKYVGYKGWFEFYNITILVLSALLTFIEAMRTRFDVSIDDMNSPSAVTMGIMPIIISTLVTISSALVKFKRYQVKMENLQQAIQKSIFTSFRLKRIQENAKHLQTDEELEKLIQAYSGEPYDLYVQSQEEMEKNLRYEDLVTHMRTYYALSLEYERNEMEYRINRMLLGARQQIRVDTVDEVAADVQSRERQNRNRICVMADVCDDNTSCCGCFGGGLPKNGDVELTNTAKVEQSPTDSKTPSITHLTV